MKNEKIPVNGFLLKAIRNEIWAANLRQAIRDQHVSLSKLAEDTNLNPLERCPEKESLGVRFRFQPKDFSRRTNLLKKFIEDPKAFGEAFLSQTLENIVNKLKIWKKHSEHGELIGMEDTEAVFPGYKPSPAGQNRIIQIAIERGYLKFGKVVGLYLTSEGLKLPKVAEAMKYKNSQMGDRIENYRE